MVCECRPKFSECQKTRSCYQHQIYSPLPVVPHYPAVLYSSSGERQPWIPLAAFEVTLHLPLEAIKEQHYCLSWVHDTTYLSIQSSHFQ